MASASRRVRFQIRVISPDDGDLTTEVLLDGEPLYIGEPLSQKTLPELKAGFVVALAAQLQALEEPLPRHAKIARLVSAENRKVKEDGQMSEMSEAEIHEAMVARNYREQDGCHNCRETLDLHCELLAYKPVEEYEICDRWVLKELDEEEV